MKNKTLYGLFFAVGILSAAEVSAQEDRWTPNECQAVATQCIRNYDGFSTPNEC